MKKENWRQLTNKEKWDRLPWYIKNEMLDEQEKQGNKRNPNIFKKDIAAGRTIRGFTWRLSNKGHDYWSNVLCEGIFNSRIELDNLNIF